MLCLLHLTRLFCSAFTVLGVGTYPTSLFLPPPSMYLLDCQDLLTLTWLINKNSSPVRLNKHWPISFNILVLGWRFSGTLLNVHGHSDWFPQAVSEAQLLIVAHCQQAIELQSRSCRTQLPLASGSLLSSLCPLHSLLWNLSCFLSSSMCYLFIHLFCHWMVALWAQLHIVLSFTSS